MALGRQAVVRSSVADEGRQREEGGLLAGKVVFISGGGRGIGAAAARLFADEGAAVMLAARTELQLRDVADEVRAGGGEAAYVRCDLADPSAVEAAIDATVRRFGRLDAAFNNGAVNQRPMPIESVPESEFDRLYTVDLKAVWVAMCAEVNAIRRTSRTGAIVNTSSVGALSANPALPVYGAMKRAVNSLTASAAVSWGPDGIRVNAIAPANTATAMIRTWERDSPGIGEQMAASSPLRRSGRPEEVAEAALWLLSDRSSFVTGVVLRVDGGAAA